MQSDVVHHESELLVLREGLEQHDNELAEMQKAKEFAQAEVSGRGGAGAETSQKHQCLTLHSLPID